MNRSLCAGIVFACLPTAILGQAAKRPMQAQSPSSIVYGSKDGQETIEIRNVTFEVAGPGIPGRSHEERLVIRKTTTLKQTVDEIGKDATTTFEAWPLGVDLKQKPLYSISATGVDGRTIDGEVLEISRGTEEIEWWSLYQLASGRRLFDSYAPIAKFSISRDTVKTRYAGLETPANDEKDARLKEPHIVGVVSYGSAERVIREALVTCADPKRAILLRSLADTTRSVSGQLDSAGHASLRVSISENYPSAPNLSTIMIPINNDDLDFAHAKIPAGLKIAPWKR